MIKVRDLSYLVWVLIVFILPYGSTPWWRYLPATLIIIASTQIVYGNLRPLGIYLDYLIFIRVLVLLFASYINAKYLINYQLAKSGITTQDFDTQWNFTVILQVLNEEIVLRSVLCFFLSKYLKAVNWCYAYGLAAVFTVLHLAFYLLAQKVLLEWKALIVIFLFGLLCNLLFLKFQHIWYGYALHGAWNLVRFTQAYFLNGSQLAEGELFNYIEGSILLMWGLVSLVFFVSLVCSAGKSRL